MRRVYLIPGMGANFKMFDQLKALDYDCIVLNWIAPRPAESMADYAERLADQIDTTTPFSLIGVSFGGMIAVELAHIIKPQKVILISSAKGQTEIPWYFR